MKRKKGQLLAPLGIGTSYLVCKAARMQGHGWACIVANPKPGVYVLQYEDGTRETLTDSE